MHAGRVNWGLLLVIVGLIALGWTTGRLPFEAFLRLAELWPVILIVIGVQMIFSRSKRPELAYLSSAILLAAAIYAIAPFWDEVRTGEKSRSYGKSEHAFDPSVSAVKIKADFGGREFTVTDAAFRGLTFSYNHELAEPTLRYEVSNGVENVDVSGMGRRLLGMIHLDPSPTWNLKLPRDLPLDLDLKARRGNCSLRMADLDVRALQVDCEKCSETVLQFGERIPQTPVHLDLRRTKLRIEVPQRFKIRLIDGADLSDLMTGELNFRRAGDDLVFDAAGTGDTSLVLEVKSGLRSLIVNRY